MILKNGKFYDYAGNVVPLEFGNREQIRLIHEHDQRASAFKGDGLNIEYDSEPKYHLQARFQCICSEAIYIDDHDAEDEFDAEGLCKDIKCHSCKRTYSVEEGAMPPELIVKLKK